MKASTDRIESARADVLRRIRDERWLRGVGLGLVADEPGIVVSVAPEGEEAARAVLEELAPDVPTRVQVLGRVRKRQRS